MSETSTPTTYAAHVANIIAYQIENNMNEHKKDPVFLEEIEFINSYMGSNFLTSWVKIFENEKAENDKVLTN